MVDVDVGDIPLRILVVHDEQNIRTTLGTCLQAAGHAVVVATSMSDAKEKVSRQVFDLIFLDVRLGTQDGADPLTWFTTSYPWSKVVAITAPASITTAVKAIKLGAIDYLPTPITPAQVQIVTQKVVERRRLDLRIDTLQSALGELDLEADLPTENAQMRRAMETARQVADSNATVLICGEMGSGKSRLARAMHAWSPRAAAPFMAVSCDTPVADELDAALFGAGVPGVASPFRSTGPVGPPGRAELCEGGTLCLEDVAQSPPSLQPKLHRFIREKEYERHNDFRSQRANVRVIGTSCVDPDEAVRRHRLRPELLLAFDVVRIEIPPLRSRPEDIRMLAQRYLTFFAKQNHRSIARFSSNAIAAMKKYPWPGNNRELRNLIERAVILCTSDEVGLEHFPPNLLNASAAVGLGDLVPLDQIEDLHIQRVLESTGSVKGAAAVLRIGVSTMVRWLKRSKRTPHPPQLELADDPLALQQAAAEAAAIAASEVRNEKPAQ